MSKKEPGFFEIGDSLVKWKRRKEKEQMKEKRLGFIIEEKIDGEWLWMEDKKFKTKALARIEIARRINEVRKNFRINELVK